MSLWQVLDATKAFKKLLTDKADVEGLPESGGCPARAKRTCLVCLLVIALQRSPSLRRRAVGQGESGPGAARLHLCPPPAWLVLVESMAHPCVPLCASPCSPGAGGSAGGEGGP